MSDKWGEIESLKFKDKLSVGSLSPNLSKSFIKESPVSLSLYITNSFLKELYDAHKQTDLSYIDIINSQISEFQLKHVERLLTRFTQLSYRVNTSLSTKYKGGRKRAEKSRNALWFAESFGLTPKAIKCESESGKNVQVNLEKEYSNIEHEDKENYVN